MRFRNRVCGYQKDLHPVISIILTVDLRRGLFQRDMSDFLHTPTVVDNPNLITDLMTIYG